MTYLTLKSSAASLALSICSSSLALSMLRSSTCKRGKGLQEGMLKQRQYVYSPPPPPHLSAERQERGLQLRNPAAEKLNSITACLSLSETGQRWGLGTRPATLASALHRFPRGLTSLRVTFTKGLSTLLMSARAVGAL